MKDVEGKTIDSKLTNIWLTIVTINWFQIHVIFVCLYNECKRYRRIFLLSNETFFISFYVSLS